MAPPNRRAQNHNNHVGKGVHCSLCRVRTPTTKAARAANDQHVLIWGPQIPEKRRCRYPVHNLITIHTQRKTGSRPILPGLYEPNHRRPGKTASHRRHDPNVLRPARSQSNHCPTSSLHRHVDWLHGRGPRIGILTNPERNTFAHHRFETNNKKLIPAHQMYVSISPCTRGRSDTAHKKQEEGSATTSPKPSRVKHNASSRASGTTRCRLDQCEESRSSTSPALTGH